MRQMSSKKIERHMKRAEWHVKKIIKINVMGLLILVQFEESLSTERNVLNSTLSEWRK